MKTILIIISIFILSSCKKDYTCKCTIRTETNGVNTYSNETTTVTGKTKKQAENGPCNSFTTTVTTTNQMTTTYKKCYL